MSKIIQIIPANENWYAGYRDADNKVTSFAQVVCWALVEDDDGDTGIVGMVNSGGRFRNVEDEDADFFGGYYRRHEDGKFRSAYIDTY